MSEQIDMRISGSTTMPGGEYGKVRISGSGKVQGNLKCESMTCSGAAKVLGDILCLGDVGISGSFQCEGNVQAKEISASGSCEVGGSLSGDSLRISGSTKIGGGIHMGQVKCSGSVMVEGDVEGDTVKLCGKTEIKGLLNAETVEISASGLSEIGDIGGTNIFVKEDGSRHVFVFFGPSCSRSMGLRVNTIEGDTVELENTTAKVVRGKRVIIGHGCRIERVEYSEHFEAAEGAVRQVVPLG